MKTFTTNGFPDAKSRTSIITCCFIDWRARNRLCSKSNQYKSEFTKGCVRRRTGVRCAFHEHVRPHLHQQTAPIERVRAAARNPYRKHWHRGTCLRSDDNLNTGWKQFMQVLAINTFTHMRAGIMSAINRNNPLNVRASVVVDDWQLREALFYKWRLLNYFIIKMCQPGGQHSSLWRVKFIILFIYFNLIDWFIYLNLLYLLNVFF